MAHRSGGGSHSGGHHSGGHSSHGGGRGGSNAPRYSNQPFPNSRRFRYYDRHGRERFLYSDRVPAKTSIASLIFQLITLAPFILAGLVTLVLFVISVIPPKPLTPEYKSPEVHIQDSADVIDNEDDLEDVLQEFEDLTGISPYIMTVYDKDWFLQYDFLDDYAYSVYVNEFSDEQHFLIVYSEPDNAEELDFVDWSWEAIQGDDTDRILTEENFERFADDLHDDFLRDNVSVGKAFENAFEKSLSYMMKKSSDDASSWGIFTLIWNLFVGIFIFSAIKSYMIGRREYQEVMPEGSGYAVPNAMGVGGNMNYQNNANYGNGEVYQSTNYSNNLKQYMYHDKKGNKKYISSSVKPIISALIVLGIVLFITVPQLFNSVPLLLELIKMYSQAGDSPVETFFVVFTVVICLWNLGLFIAIFFAVRHVIVVSKRDYVEVPMNSGSGAQYNAAMPNNAAQYNDAAQYNAAGAADSDFYNDDARFRGPEYYDEDARYRGSTAYEAGKK